MTRILRTWFAAGATLGLGACGTVVPGLQELAASGEEQLLVQAIVGSVQCEVASAVHEFIKADVDFKTRNRGRRSAAWLDGWGAQVALTLTVAEKTALSPGATILPASPPTSVFSLGLGGTVSAEATRTDKLNYFYTVKNLYDRGPCRAGIQPRRGTPSPIIQSDLKLRDWLFDQAAPGATGVVEYPVSAKNVSGQNVLSHEVKFQVVTEGETTPSWRLVRAVVNPSGPLLQASRDRTSDLIVTFGPLDPSQDNRGLIPQAENVHFVQQLGLANASNLPRVVMRQSLF